MGKVYDVITDRIIELLERGVVPWHKPWSGGGAPKNLISMKEYRGVNVFMLSAVGYESPYWLTFKQAAGKGGRVKKGERGVPVVYWKWCRDGEDDGSDEEEHKEGGGRSRGFPLYSTVFNVSQCEGVEYPKTEVKVGPFSPLEVCELIAEGYPRPQPNVERTHPRAFYRPSTDLVGMPKPERFERAEDFYCTLFHELTHSTGHVSRLARPEILKGSYFGSNDYSKEELVAEMGAAFLCGRAGIESRVLDNSASYIGSWLGKLRNDKRLVVSVIPGRKLTRPPVRI